jgi:hypothetical protein
VNDTELSLISHQVSIQVGVKVACIPSRPTSSNATSWHVQNHYHSSTRTVDVPLEINPTSPTVPGYNRFYGAYVGKNTGGFHALTRCSCCGPREYNNPRELTFWLAKVACARAEWLVSGLGLDLAVITRPSPAFRLFKPKCWLVQCHRKVFFCSPLRR